MRQGDIGRRRASFPPTCKDCRLIGHRLQDVGDGGQDGSEAEARGSNVGRTRSVDWGCGGGSWGLGRGRGSWDAGSWNRGSAGWCLGLVVRDLGNRGGSAGGWDRGGLGGCLGLVVLDLGDRGRGAGSWNLGRGSGLGRSLGLVVADLRHDGAAGWDRDGLGHCKSEVINKNCRLKS